MLPKDRQNRQDQLEPKEFTILGIAPWGFALIVSEIVFFILALIAFATGKPSFALWGFGQLVVVFAAGAWFTRNVGKEPEEEDRKK